MSQDTYVQVRIGGGRIVIEADYLNESYHLVRQPEATIQDRLDAYGWLDELGLEDMLDEDADTFEIREDGSIRIWLALTQPETFETALGRSSRWAS